MQLLELVHNSDVCIIFQAMKFLCFLLSYISEDFNAMVGCHVDLCSSYVLDFYAIDDPNMFFFDPFL